MDNKVVVHLIDQLKRDYKSNLSSNITPSINKQGKKYEYLGMLLDYMTRSKVRIDMRKYITKVLGNPLDKYNSMAVTSHSTSLR